MTRYFVSNTGDDSANGQVSTPWRTIGRAFQADLRPGDEIVVAPGTYREAIAITKSGSAAADIVLRSEVPGEALIRPPSGAWNAVSVYANYVTIDGFDIRGGNGDGIEANDVHHISVLNNTVHGAGESGIQFNWAEFIRIEGNHTYENAGSGWFSGISVYQSRNITGDTTTPGYRTVIRNNVSHDNLSLAGLHTDGNGIIVDDFQSTQTSGYPNYTFPTLIENNLVYENGGKGIAVHWSDYVTVRNNTAWHNNQDLANDGTWRGELSNQDARNNIWVNNIAVADPGVNPNNTAIGFYGSNRNVVWANNLTFNGATGDASLKLEGGSNPAPSTTNGNLLGVDPGFVGAPGDFRLANGSPALDAGSALYGLAAEDLDGGDRTVGTVDIGAYERDGGGAANRAPSAGDDSDFVIGVSDTLVIPAADLLTNDSDPDGDPLSLASVGSAVGGTVSQNANGDVVFSAGAAGAEGGFSYVVSDGRGGAATARVSITVAEQANAAPIAEPDFASTPANASVWIDVLANDRDPDGDPLRVTSTSVAAAYGSASAAQNGVVYDPRGAFDALAAGERTTVSLSYVVGDGRGGQDTASIQVSVAGINDAPVAVDDAGFRVAEGASVAIPVADLLGNDSDVDGDALALVSVGSAAGGTARIEKGSVIFTASQGAGGSGSFVYRVSDGGGLSDEALVSVAIDPLDPPPTDVFHFWDSGDEPAVSADPDRASVELGMRFTADVDGDVTGLRFYRSPENDGPHTGTLWSESGSRLGTVTFADGTGDGWQEAAFDTPVPLEAGQSYVASYFAPFGAYSVSEGFFGAAVDHGPLSTPVDAGVYRYASTSAFPFNTYQSSNYWVDVAFEPTPADPPVEDVDTSGDGVGGAKIEFGSSSFHQAGADSWTRVAFSEAIPDPVVVVGPFTHNGGDPATPRVRNVTETGFELQIDEWDYLDGWHTVETASWMAMSAGTYLLPDGRTISAGETTLRDDRAATVALNGFDETPLVFTQVASDADPAAVTTRVWSTSAESFSVRLYEQEAADGRHAPETVAYVAIEQGAGSNLLAAATPDSVTHIPYAISLEESDAVGFRFLAAMQTRDGPDTAALRYERAPGGVNVFVEEEQSRDLETNHTTEVVGYLATTEKLISLEPYLDFL